LILYRSQKIEEVGATESKEISRDRRNQQREAERPKESTKRGGETEGINKERRRGISSQEIDGKCKQKKFKDKRCRKSIRNIKKYKLSKKN
jgi:hypothetical protein